MGETEMDEIAEAWIAGTENSEKADGPHWWAIEKVMDWHLEGEPAPLWQFILNLNSRELPERVIAILAAGPLEDLLAGFGPDYIDEVETLARRDPKFRCLLAGVWRNTITEDVWERVKKARGEV